nr:BTB/POZ domain-containing protein At5g66560-like [Ipomoea batatas]
MQLLLSVLCRLTHELITEQETKPSGARIQKLDGDGEIEEEGVDDEGVEEEEELQCRVSLPNFSGGSEAFEVTAKFCYGVKIDLSASNVAPLRWASITEEYSEKNLISKTKRSAETKGSKSLLFATGLIPTPAQATVVSWLQTYKVEDIKQDYDTGKGGVTMVTREDALFADSMWKRLRGAYICLIGSFYKIIWSAMKSYRLSELSQSEVDKLKTRPRIDFSFHFSTVQPLVNDVRSRGDVAVKT